MIIKKPKYKVYRSEKAETMNLLPNAGLYFDRFLGFKLEIKIQDRQNKQEEPTSKDYLDDFIEKIFSDSSKYKNLLKRKNEKLDAVTKKLGGSVFVFKVTSKLTVGLGNPNLTENGFSFEHTTGLPVIPGSSVKGMVLSGARICSEEEQAKRLLGEGAENDKKNTEHKGYFVFLDAFPDANSYDKRKYCVDVMTPHSQNNLKEGFPVETIRTTPIHFLTLGKNIVFVFRVIPIDSDKAEEMALIEKWLSIHLKYSGAGAKTALGYGSMIRVEN